MELASVFNKHLTSQWGSVMDIAGLVQDCDTVALHCFPSWPWLAVWLFENLSVHLTACLKQFRSPYTFIQVLLIDSFGAVHTQSGNVAFQLSPCDLPLSRKNVIYGLLNIWQKKTKQKNTFWNIDRASMYLIKRCFLTLWQKISFTFQRNPAKTHAYVNWQSWCGKDIKTKI